MSVYLMDVPSYPRALLITDAAVNIAPDLSAKRDIVQDAIDLALVMGIATPRVAILAALETVNPQMRSTIDAAALCKMADRGQIQGGLLDGPLAFDNAVSPEAAAEKGIVSPVAGRADILLVPDLEAGNMLAKQLTFLAGADAAVARTEQLSRIRSGWPRSMASSNRVDPRQHAAPRPVFEPAAQCRAARLVRARPQATPWRALAQEPAQGGLHVHGLGRWMPRPRPARLLAALYHRRDQVQYPVVQPRPPCLNPQRWASARQAGAHAASTLGSCGNCR